MSKDNSGTAWQGTSKVKAWRLVVLVVLCGLLLSVGSTGLVEARAQGAVLEGSTAVWRKERGVYLHFLRSKKSCAGIKKCHFKNK